MTFLVLILVAASALFAVHQLFRGWQEPAVLTSDSPSQDTPPEGQEPASGGSRRGVFLRRGAVILACLGLAYGLFQWQGWRVPYTPLDVYGMSSADPERPGVRPEALEALNQIRVRTRHRWWVVTGYRAPWLNKLLEKNLGAHKKSPHMKGRAFDLWVTQGDREVFYEAAKEAGFKGYGWAAWTVHVELRRDRKWWVYDGVEVVHRSRKREFLHQLPENFIREHKLKPPPEPPKRP